MPRTSSCLGIFSEETYFLLGQGPGTGLPRQQHVNQDCHDDQFSMNYLLELMFYKYNQSEKLLNFKFLYLEPVHSLTLATSLWLNTPARLLNVTY